MKLSPWGKWTAWSRTGSRNRKRSGSERGIHVHVIETEMKPDFDPNGIPDRWWEWSVWPIDVEITDLLVVSGTMHAPEAQWSEVQAMINQVAVALRPMVRRAHAHDRRRR